MQLVTCKYPPTANYNRKT